MVAQWHGPHPGPTSGDSMVTQWHGQRPGVRKFEFKYTRRLLRYEGEHFISYLSLSVFRPHKITEGSSAVIVTVVFSLNSC